MIRLWVCCRALLAAAIFAPVAPATAEEPGATREAATRSAVPRFDLGGGLRVQNIRRPAPTETGLTVQAAASTSQCPYPHPRPPIDGFSPLVVATTSDDDTQPQSLYEHIVRSSYTGASITAPGTRPWSIAIFDSGAQLDLIGTCDRPHLGISAGYLTPNTVPLGGASGTVDADVSMPIGFYAQGFQAVDANGNLDYGQLVGHSNVSVGALPDSDCGSDGELPTIVGNTTVGFFTTEIRVDQPRSLNVDGQVYRSPTVRILPQGSLNLAGYPRFMSMTASGIGPLLSATYYPNIFDFENPDDPWLPTFLGVPGTLSFGGAFFSQIDVLQGTPGPTNTIRTMRVLNDTGAQTCIMTPGMAANLSLPLQPDFTIDVLGVGGTTTDVPGYYIDYVRVNALGGALEFSRVPFVILDVGSPDGQNMDGVLGMNLFWNRNVVYDPRLTTTGALRFTEPVLAYGDYDRDTDVDGDDLNLFLPCVTGPGLPQSTPECLLMDADGDCDVDQDDFGRFQRCLTGPGIAALPGCEL